MQVDGALNIFLKVYIKYLSYEIFIILSFIIIIIIKANSRIVKNIIVSSRRLLIKTLIIDVGLNNFLTLFLNLGLNPFKDKSQINLQLF